MPEIPMRPNGSPHIDDDACLDLLHGLLSRSEATVWLDHLETCPECERRFHRSSTRWEETKAGPRLARDRHGRLGLARPPVEDEARPRRREAGASGWRRWLRAPIPVAVLAGAAGLAMLAWFLLDRIDDAAIPAYPGYRIPAGREVVRVRGAEADASDAFFEGVRAYEAGDDARAVRLFREARPSPAFEELRAIYLAAALLGDGEPADALAVLDGASLATIPEPWRSESLWLRYIALGRARRPEAAEAVLAELVTRPGDIGDRARAWRDQSP